MTDSLADRWALVTGASQREVKAVLKTGETVSVTGDGLRFAAPSLQRVPAQRRIRRGAIVRVRSLGPERWEIVQLPEADYRIVPVNGTKLVAYEVSYPVHGSYSQLRKFLAQVLHDLPMASLDDVSFLREAVSQAELAGRLDVTQGAISKFEHAEDVAVVRSVREADLDQISAAARKFAQQSLRAGQIRIACRDKRHKSHAALYAKIGEDL